MLLKHVNMPKIKCKVANFIRLPKVIPIGNYNHTPLEVFQFYTLHLYKVYYKKHSTIFYLKANTVYFYNDKDIHVSRIIPIYDYKNGKIAIISGRHVPSNVMWGSWRCVKAPNGNLYAVYMKEMFLRETGERGMRLFIHNLSNDKIIYNVAYGRSEMQTGTNIDNYVYIVLNSFVVGYKVTYDSFHLWVVDLVAETVDNFTYTPHDYMSGLLEVITSEDEKNHISDILWEYISNMPFWSNLYPHESINYILSLFDNEIPFIRYLEFTLNIRCSAVHEEIDKALVVSLSYVDNMLEVRFSTGKDVVIIKNPTKDTIVIPSDYVLFSKKYKLDSSYDIFKSYPYYIYKVSRNYIFGTKEVFKNALNNKNDYTAIQQRSELFGFNNITVLRTKTGILANLEKYRKSRDNDLNFYEIARKGPLISVIDLNKIYIKLRNLKDEGRYNYDDFIDVSDLVIEINVENKILDMMRRIYKNAESVDIKKVKYYYYLDETNGNLYISVMVYKDNIDKDNPVADFYVFEYNIRRVGLPNRIVVHLVSYDSGMSSAASIFANNSGNKIHFFETFMRLYPYDKTKRIYMYNNEIMLLNDIFVIRVIDIKHNRSVHFDYVPKNIKDRLNVILYHVADRNVISPITIFTDDDGEDTWFRYVIVLSSLELIVSLDLTR